MCSEHPERLSGFKNLRGVRCAPEAAGVEFIDAAGVTRACDCRPKGWMMLNDMGREAAYPVAPRRARLEQSAVLDARIEVPYSS